ncbi:glycoside hydrolase family 3 protein [Phycicoccus endophyticus]|uniref:Glycoside hydrolase family 3 protein n=1 Tax=Phycicoccus endophyticus TaxID=1690220 RepID=A0A7G9QZE6_9MICO|nr:glycoside hydrolase family 3 N-terminal domain-containing protein [Phycicoccus endophyticus]NHI19079.1 glycoside hydrolase family 3 protein [Phycicoccus endophyticus]QNN48721.1 glycoside hydrolase family 3 protein [Phycicoccus endophyticus]GGL32630.1 hydrolase [Phycicoccus endophyticus]
MTLDTDLTAVLQPGFSGTHVPPWLLQAREQGLLSVCLYGDNAGPDGGVAEVCAALVEATPGVLVAADEEGGDVTRLHYPDGAPSVGNAVLGRLDDPAVTRAAARGIGSELAALGVGLDLAPVVDVNSSPENPVIGVRSFGADPEAVARHTAAWVTGLQGTGVAACAKHFPGHGDTVADSHHDLPRVDAPAELLQARELRPFRAAVDAGVAAVMTSHILLPALDPTHPATFSPAVLALLRDGLGFEGTIVSDALDMAGASARTGIPEAAVRALAAGVDLLCLGPATGAQRLADVRRALREAVETGRLPRTRVAEAAARVRVLADRTLRPAPGPVEPPVPLAEAARAFTLTERARRFACGPAPLALVQVPSASNLAVGGVAWGPQALGETVAEEAVPPGARVAVVGRSIGPGHPAHEVRRRLAARGHDVVLVECGWPRGGADVETWGSSPAVAAALLHVLGGGRR